MLATLEATQRDSGRGAFARSASSTSMDRPAPLADASNSEEEEPQSASRWDDPRLARSSSSVMDDREKPEELERLTRFASWARFLGIVMNARRGYGSKDARGRACAPSDGRQERGRELSHTDRRSPVPRHTARPHVVLLLGTSPKSSSSTSSSRVGQDHHA